MKKQFTVGSLFAGVGGICLGFKEAFTEDSEYKLLWANEIDDYACATYKNNFNHFLIEGDIKKVLNPNEVDNEINMLKFFIESNKNDINRTDEVNKKEKQLAKLKENRDTNYNHYCEMNEKILEQPIDILNGGFPCQAFSIAGEQKGFDDERGNLFLNIIDLINKLGEKFYKPRILFLENVKNLKSHDKGRTYVVIKKKLEECGYSIYEHILNTMDYSDIPQNRERIYIIGFLNKKDAEKFSLFNEIEKYKIKKSAAERKRDIMKVIDYSSNKDNLEKYYYTKEKYPKYFISQDEYVEGSNKGVRINLEEQINEMYQFYQLRRGMYVRKNMSNVCPTLTANMGTGGHNVPLIKVNDGIRKLTPTETFKLQGFPIGNGYNLPSKFENRNYPDSQFYKQAGNAVSVPVIKFLAKNILNIIEEN